MATCENRNNVLEFVREEDFVEYFLFPQVEYSEHKVNGLEILLKQINEVIKPITYQHIWHKDEFSLTICSEEHRILLEKNTSLPLPPHLYGITHYGENIQDEWFIVYLICEITKNFPGIIGRLVDSDGEFLLIEAAEVLPQWANPDTCKQCVYIYNGHLHLVQNSLPSKSTILPVSTAVYKIWQNPSLYKVPKEIQLYIDDRLKNFAGNMASLYHYQVVKVPLAVAAILKEKPSLIAPACRAFNDRDLVDMKACYAMRYFPPENRIRTRIKFTRCLYAMLVRSNYIPDHRIGWNLPSRGTEQFKEEILGVKIACGFEILVYQARQDDFANDRSWKTYLNDLIKKGYFKEYLEGSVGYNNLLKEAKCFYKKNLYQFSTSSVVGKEILSYLKDSEINAEKMKAEENNLLLSESDSWLNISPEEFDGILSARYRLNKSLDCSVDAAKFTRNIEEFLGHESGIDGIESSSVYPVQRNEEIHKNTFNQIDTIENNENKLDEISFDPNAFQNYVKNFLDFFIPEDDWESTSEMSDYENDNLEKSIEDHTCKNVSSSVADFKFYMEQMDRELANTSEYKIFKVDEDENASLSKTPKCNDDFDDVETFEPVNINVNTLKNMMRSYEAQEGGPGPITNMLNAMHFGIKIDNDHNDEK